MSDTKPIFKRVNGEWVKQDAFQRVSGAWVRISMKSTWTAPTIQLDDSVVSTPIVEGVIMYKVYSNGSYIGYVDSDNVWHGEVSE